jgi:vacuolar-type H+-ATPase subunit H
LDTFEAIILDAGMNEKDIVLELYKKMSEKAQRIMKYILNSGDDSYKSIRENGTKKSNELSESGLKFSTGATKYWK